MSAFIHILFMYVELFIICIFRVSYLPLVLGIQIIGHRHILLHNYHKYGHTSLAWVAEIENYAVYGNRLAL